MANLVESSVWENGIYQLEITDPVQGGTDGIDNVQAKQLANRTTYLKEVIENAVASIKNKKSATFVIGNSNAGHTAGDVDFLCTGANDHAVINNAIAALPAGGGKIIIQEGTYNLGGSINVDKNNVTIQGMGPSTILRAASVIGSSSGLINVTGHYCKIADLKITNNTAVVNGIYISGSNNTVTGNTCFNSGYESYGIYISGDSNTVTGNTCSNSGSNNTVTGNTCSNSGSNNSIGIYISGGSNCVISGNIIANKRISGQSISNTAALYITNNSDYCAVHGNNLRGVTGSSGTAYTVSGTSSATLPGSATTIGGA